ncbi:hypothetical protein SAMN02745174_02273 [Cetobacterium ceti]|uniref:Phage DNA packaging protein, Nu1 subunit of terminase n=1 Tax=Cetobacterium ceti TaxID=180163 RepID=A0A1T4QCM9_9FUSO|nr:hypothetical protein [Cetobacterium ceti]SKA01455.1 hypothetical protein SAMN02745174_02273 [Cetobacterium ceti]
MKIEATENQLARLFKESERTIRDKYKQARIAPGKYDLINVIETYVSNIKKTISKDEIEEIEKNYKKSKVALNEAKLKIIEEEYISIDEVTEAVSTMIFNFKSKIMSLPKKIVIDLKKCTTSFEQEKTIERHVKKALGELKEYLELHEGD